MSERHLTDLAAYFGFTIARVQDLPPSTRSITDLRHRVIYVPQRNATGGMRSARSVIAQTLGHFALGHRDPADFEDYVRQRVEANYFAGALLAPERAVVRVLADAKAREDISVEDLNEMFYISYEMAAHRLTNLITRHFDIPVHFQRSDPEGLLWKAYENDGVLLPADVDGTIEGQRLCRWWSSRQAFESEDSYSLHYQYTETVAGTFWCVTHIDVEPRPRRCDHDRHRRPRRPTGSGAATPRGKPCRRCPDPACCRRPADDAVRRWEGMAWPSARDHSHFVSGLPTDTVVFSPHPGVDLTDVYSFLDRHSRGLAVTPDGQPRARVDPSADRLPLARVGLRIAQPRQVGQGGRFRGPQNRTRTRRDRRSVSALVARRGVVPVPAGVDRPAGPGPDDATSAPRSRPS